MKLSGLFAQYLYQHKELRLPGIGIFTVSEVTSAQHTEHKAAHEPALQILFSQKQVLSPDEELIEFIRTKTGKLKPLAEADVDSFLNDGKTLLNIGKPFYIPGIGSLSKNRLGQYEFHTGEPILDRIEPPNAQAAAEPPGEGPASKTRSIFVADAAKRNSNRILLVSTMIVIAILVVIWGGYNFYHSHVLLNKATTPEPAATSNSASLQPPEQVVTRQGDTVAAAHVTPARNDTPATLNAARASYRFIIETTHSKRRALYRYNLLKSYELNIKMDTPPDSSLFKLYFSFPAAAKDTAHIKDSLQRTYASRRVIIER